MNFEYKIDHNSRNKNQKIDFSFVSIHSASFIKVRSKLMGGGHLHIISWDKVGKEPVLELVKCRRNDPCMTANENFVRCAHSLQKKIL